MAKRRRDYKRDRRGRFASISGAAAKRIAQRPTAKSTSTSFGFRAGMIETRGVKLTNPEFVINRTRKLNSADVRGKR